MAVQQLQHTHGTTVVPSDTLYLFQSLGYPYRVSSALFVGVGGSVRVLTEGGDDVVFSSVPDGTFMPVHVVKVFATGTTASSIVAVDLSNLNPFDADAAAFFARVTTAGGSLSATEQTAIETLVLQMKADGIWSKIKAVYPMVGASAAACAQNLKSSSFTGTFTSGWTFASTGVTPNGTSAYMDTGLNADTELLGDSSHLAVYSRTLNSGGGDKYQIGAYSTSPVSFYAIDLYGPGGYLGALGSTSTFNTAPVTNTQGFIGIKKETNNDQKSFRNSTILQTTTQTSTVKPNLNIWVAALNLDSAGFGYSGLQLAFASIGDGLTDAELSDYYTAVQAFQTTLSRQV